MDELRAAHPFGNLTDGQLAELAARGTFRTAQAGDVICRPGEPSDGLYVVITGRVRAERFGPRTLDVDVLLVGDLTVDEPDLVVPHPRMWRRRFVLAPLADLADGEVKRLGPL